MLSKRRILNLNRDCYCFPIDREAITQSIRQSVPEVIALDGMRANLFAGTGILVDSTDVEAMLGVIDAIETLTNSEQYRADKMNLNPGLAPWQSVTGTGMIMGYDFHIDANGPELIEVNTNAGGAFIVNEVLSATNQIYPPCCGFASLELKRHLLPELLSLESESVGRQGMSVSAAIVDSGPTDQYLYPDMQIAKNYFESTGIKTVITDIADLTFDSGVLHSHGEPIDIVYNRSTDFSLQTEASAALRDAALAGAAIVAPNPLHHALYADKANFIEYTDEITLKKYGLSETQRHCLKAHVPPTVLLNSDNAVEFYERRKQLFFKPVDGYGSKAVYRGDKITSRVWKQILHDTEQGRGYIAQSNVPPSLRAVGSVAERKQLKYDVRIFTTGGVPLISAARIYQGQTTNFRTVGGGFAPVYSWSEDETNVASSECYLKSNAT